MDLQGTVRSFDRESRSGSVVLDDGRTIDFGAAAFDAGGLRLLRVGQRVRLRTAQDSADVTVLTLATFAFPG